MINDLVLNRILSPELIKSSEAMRTEILLDTTPVPVFGDYLKSKIITVGINPSRREFPIGEVRRLAHLSDLGLPKNYYQLGLTSMTTNQANKIDEGLIKYFESGFTYWDWFGHSEKALNIGLGASYSKSNHGKMACHLDIFPWATNAFSKLRNNIKNEFIDENRNFVKKFIAQNSITILLILGGQSYNLLKKQLNWIPKDIKSSPGPFNSKFESGIFDLTSTPKRYFYTSKGPSAQFDKKTNKPLKIMEKNEIHMAFGEFIKKF